MGCFARRYLRTLWGLLSGGGVLVLECFGEAMHDVNVEMGTNYGPGLWELLGLKMVREEMGRLRLDLGVEEERELMEGSFHRVKRAALVRVVGRKDWWDGVVEGVLGWLKGKAGGGVGRGRGWMLRPTCTCAPLTPLSATAT
jgi:hypothetical protein